MSQPTEVKEHEDRRTGSSWIKWSVIVFLLSSPFLLFLTVVMYFQFSGGAELREALEEVERLDPGWRVEDIEAKRLSIADHDNSAKQIREIQRWKPRGVPSRQLSELVQKIGPVDELNDEQVNRLRAEIGASTIALDAARKLANMPRGRLASTLDPLYGWTATADQLQDIRSATDFLRYDAWLRAHDGDVEGALESCRAMVNASRTGGDEPTVIAMLVRIACRAIALRVIERVLVTGEASEVSLALLQKALEEDAQEPLLLIAARGDRALSDQALQQLQAGTISLSKFLAHTYASGADEKITGFSPIDTVLIPLRHRFITGPIKRNRAALLHFNTQYVEAAKLPFTEQRHEIKRLQKSIQRMPGLALALVGGKEKTAEAHYRVLAEIHCTIAAVAAERFRLANSRWPDSLNELVPKFLAQLPADPYFKGPIRTQKLNDGLVTYSVGVDETDNGGKLDRSRPPNPGSDLGFRLWDINHRRQPPKPKPPEPSN